MFYPVYKQSGLSRVQCLLLSALRTVMEVAQPFCPYKLNFVYKVAENLGQPRSLIKLIYTRGLTLTVVTIYANRFKIILVHFSEH